MTPEQALQFFINMVVFKDGTSIPDAAAALQAWNIIVGEIQGKGMKTPAPLKVPDIPPAPEEKK